MNATDPTTPTSAATLIVPCYNEAARLDAAAFQQLVDARPGLRLLMVNDGSADDTEGRLRALAAARPDRIAVLSLPENCGKGEAVRRGLRAALAERPALVGYVDADLSTPVGEILRLLRFADEHAAAEVAMGSRIAFLGADIERRAVRHHLGRVFATCASLLLRAEVYDTQCGAKVLRPSPALGAALEVPFLSRWAFDVELLGRLLAGAPGVAALPLAAIRELPLGAWRDVPGSKLRPAAVVGTLKDLAMIGLDLRRRRRAAGTS